MANVSTASCGDAWALIVSPEDVAQIRELNLGHVIRIETVFFQRTLQSWPNPTGGSP